MSEIQIKCNTCNKKMIIVSTGGSTLKHVIKQTWECPKCKRAVMVVGIDL